MSSPISTPTFDKQAAALLARFMRVEKNGNLARHVLSLVASNRRKATKQELRPNPNRLG